MSCVAVLCSKDADKRFGVNMRKPCFSTHCFVPRLQLMVHHTSAWRCHVISCVVLVVVVTAQDLEDIKESDATLRGTRQVHNRSRGFDVAVSSAWHGVKQILGSMWNEIKRPAFTGDEVSASIEQVLHSVASNTVRSCNISDPSLLQLEGATFDAISLSVLATGVLAKKTHGGNVSVRVKLGKLYGNMTIVQRVKRRFLWALGEQRRTWEPLCNNLGRNHAGCPLKVGTQQLRLSLSNLPDLQFRAAGAYNMEVRALDNDGKLITCLKLDLPFFGSPPIDTHLRTASTTVTTTSMLLSSWEPWQVVRV